MGNFAGNSYGKLLREILMGNSCGKILWEILAGNSCGKILWKSLENLVRSLWENLVRNSGNSCRKILWEILVGNAVQSCGKSCGNLEEKVLWCVMGQKMAKNHQIDNFWLN